MRNVPWPCLYALSRQPRPTRSSACRRHSEQDKRPHKVNLSVGVYVDDTGVTPVIPSVLEAERRLLKKSGSKGYLPIDGSLHTRPPCAI